MDAQTLIQSLAHPEAQRRLDAARVIGMVEEVAALPALAQAYQRETNIPLKQMMAWAGQKLKTAQASGYTTLDALWAHFHIAREYTPAEVDTDNVVVMSSQRRVMPLEPTQTAIAAHARRLLHDPAPDKRRKAALSLRDLNNLAALPVLARAVTEDKDATVREAAQLAGKLLYWNAVYWTMAQDGRLAQEINRRAAQFVEQSSATTGKATRATQDIERARLDELLKRARDKKKKR